MDIDRPRLTGGASRRRAMIAVAAVPLAYLAVFFGGPLAAVLTRGFAVDSVGEVLGDRRLRAVAWFTLWQAVVSTVLTVLVALPGAWTLARYRFRGRSLVWAAVTVPFVLPTVVVAAAFVALLGPRGPLGGLGLYPGLGAVLIAHVFFNYAVVVRTVGNAFTHVDVRAEEAARVLGATAWRAFREVSLPLVRPAMMGAASIVFLFSFTSFGAMLLLGGPRRVTVDVEIWKQTAYFLDLETAATLAALQLVFVVVALAVYGRTESRTVARRIRREALVATSATTPGRRAFLAANLAAMGVLVGGPIAVLVQRSVDTAGGIGLGFYRALGSSRRGTTLFVPPAEAIRNSLVFAAVATAIALVVGGIAAGLIGGRRRGETARAGTLDVALTLPLGTSAVTLGLGCLLAFDDPPFDFRGEPWLLPLIHALLAVPFVIRILVPALRAIDPSLREAASLLGASPARVALHVDLPLVWRAAVVAAGFAFTISLGEFAATSFLVRPDHPTMPVAIARYLGQPGVLNVGQAMAMSTILAAVTTAVILTIERFRVGSIGTF